jgi:hypothetical protein
VTGEKLVSPGSIVNLAFKARYVYPTTPRDVVARPKVESQAILPNGDGPEEKVKSAAPNDAVDVAEKVEGGVSNGDVKEKIEEVKDVILEKTQEIVEKAEKKVGRKGKVEEKKEWKSNGFAYAPHWPMVSGDTTWFSP